MDIPGILLETLENLTSRDLKTFKWYLSQDVLEDVQPIPRSKLENAIDRIDVVDAMLNSYPNGAVQITVKILRDINRRDLAEKLVCFVGKPKDVEVPSETCDPEQDKVANEMVKMLKEFENPEQKLLIINVVKKELNLDQYEISYYKMPRLPRGVCLIINNERFKSLKDRQGSDIDAVSLARVFSWLGFWVVNVEDQGAEQMRDILRLFAGLNPNSLSELQKHSVKEWAGERKEFIDLDGLIQHGDAFVCCILSHGCSEGIYGTHGEVLPHNELLSFFDGSNCSALKDKPKLFFIEACRIEADKDNTASTSDKTAKPSSDDTGKSENAPSKSVWDITRDSDMLIAMASVDKQISVRAKKSGTWFIQSLCKQLQQGCIRGEDILMILTDVGGEVSEKEGCIGNDRKITKQLPEVTSRLRSRLVLPVPPLCN